MDRQARRELDKKLGDMGKPAALAHLQREMSMSPDQAAAYYRESAKRGNRAAYIFAAVFILAGITMLGLSVRDILKHIEVSGGVNSLGTVTGTSNERDPSDRGPNTRRIFFHHFRYEVDGREYQTRSGYGHALQMGKGAEVPIRYSPEHPELAEMINPKTGELYRAWMNPLWGLSFSLGGAILLVGIRIKVRDDAT